jgi:hypothetical protein
MTTVVGNGLRSVVHWGAQITTSHGRKSIGKQLLMSGAVVVISGMAIMTLGIQSTEWPTDIETKRRWALHGMEGVWGTVARIGTVCFTTGLGLLFPGLCLVDCSAILRATPTPGPGQMHTTTPALSSRCGRLTQFLSTSLRRHG